METLILLTLSTSTISAGAMAGVYFAFSGFIMASLDQQGPDRAKETMNTINRVILRSWFMPLFFGSTLMNVIILLVAALNSELPGRGALIAGASIYIIGMFGCTAVFNVPLNNRLANTAGESGKSINWSDYCIVWTRWNHLRSVSCVATTVLGLWYLTQPVQL